MGEWIQIGEEFINTDHLANVTVESPERVRLCLASEALTEDLSEFNYEGDTAISVIKYFRSISRVIVPYADPIALPEPDDEARVNLPPVSLDDI